MPHTLVLTHTVRTCRSMPAQWDAWTTDGQYLYLRYRHGVGSVETYPGRKPQEPSLPPSPSP